MANINSIEINQFRGIRQLTISNFSKINLIVGDNNSGKTTFLEAVQLLFAKSQLSSVKNIIKQRTVLNVSESSFYTSFIKMFNVNQESELLDFDIYAVSNNGPIRFEMRGRERTISGEEALQMSTMSLGQKAHYKKESGNSQVIFGKHYKSKWQKADREGYSFYFFRQCKCRSCD